jgi:hypothetical protein
MTWLELSIWPTESPPARRRPRRKRRLQQIAAGRGFPIQHLAGGKDTRQAAKHEVGIDFAERNPARGRDRTRDRRDAGEMDGYRVDQAGEVFRA